MQQLDLPQQQSRSGPQSEATLDPVAEITGEVENLWGQGPGPALPPIKTQGTGTSAKWKVSWRIRFHFSFCLFLAMSLSYAPQSRLPSSDVSFGSIGSIRSSFLLDSMQIPGCQPNAFSLSDWSLSFVVSACFCAPLCNAFRFFCFSYPHTVIVRFYPLNTSHFSPISCVIHVDPHQHRS